MDTTNMITIYILQQLATERSADEVETMAEEWLTERGWTKPRTEKEDFTAVKSQAESLKDDLEELKSTIASVIYDAGELVDDIEQLEVDQG